MEIFSKNRGINKPLSQRPDQSVIIKFSYGQTDIQPIFLLEDKLDGAISYAGVGYYDGNEIAADGSDGVLYMYGPDGDKLFGVVKPILEATPFMKGATVIIRYGSPEDKNKENRIILNP